MSDELKPCPWCGKVPILHRSYSKYLLLHNCDVIKSNIGWKKSKRELVELWNNQGDLNEHSN